VSLNWDITKCSEAARSEEGWPATQSVIWSTMAVEIGTITEDNAKEFVARLELLNRVGMGVISKVTDDGFEPLTGFELAQVVRERIGLTTNVFPNAKRASWTGRVMKQLMRDIDAQAAADLARVDLAEETSECARCGEALGDDARAETAAGIIHAGCILPGEETA
jgi:hypothetical protein